MTWFGKPLAVLASLLALLVGCTPTRVETPAIPETVVVPSALSTSFLPPPPARRTIPTIPLSQAPVRLPEPGDRSPFGSVVSEDLAAAFRALIERRPDRGLAALERAEASRDMTVLWQVSLLRIDMMALAGRPEDAEKETAVTARRERLVLDHALNALASRGSARMIQGDLESAFADFAAVVLRTRDWRLPVSYSGPPSNLTEIIALTAAQLRAFSGLARLYFRAGNYPLAAAWADAAENRYNEVHYLAQNPEFGRLIPAYLDSYLARAENLLVRGAAGLALGQNLERSLRDFSDAEAFYFRIGFRYGRISADAMRALGLLAAGHAEAALTAATVALNQAEEQRFPDLAWRLGVIRARALRILERAGDAAAAYDRAWHAVALLAGHPGADHDPTRLGMSVDEITYFLIQQKARANDLPGTYEALEQAIGSRYLRRLSHVAVNAQGHETLLRELTDIDRRLRDYLLYRSAPTIIRPDQPAIGPDETALRARRATLVKQLRTRMPPLADLFAISVPRLVQVRSRLPDNAVLLYALPAEGADQVKWLLIEPSAAHLLTSGANADALATVIGGLRDAVTARDGTAQAELIRRLTSLVSPAELIGDRLAYVVPSGIANLLPWGALDVRAPIVLLPTAAYLLDDTPPPAGDGVLVANGPSEPDGGQPGAAEAEAVAALYGTTVAEDASAEAALRRRIADGARVFHFTGACRLNLRRPMQSGLLVSAGGRSVVPDPPPLGAPATAAGQASVADYAGLLQQLLPGAGANASESAETERPLQPQTEPLTAADLYRNPLPVGLAVYSRCAVGTGPLADADGLLAFARSHRLAGTRTVLHSLWEVDEAARNAFMTTFHFQAQRGNWATAWLTARNTIRARGFPPGAVGAFVLVGDARE